MTRTVVNDGPRPGSPNYQQTAKNKFKRRVKGPKQGGNVLGLPSPSKGNKPPNGNGNHRGSGNRPGNTRYGAMAGFPGVRYGDAVDLVNAQLKPQINDIRNERQQLRRETQAERQRARRQYSSAVGDIQHIYGETGDYIGYQNQAIQDQYAGLTDRTQQAQAALLNQLQANNTQVAGGANAELARLGIQQVAPAALAQMQTDQQFTEDQAAITGQNNLANISAAQSGAADVGNLLLGMNAGGMASSFGQAAKAKSDSLFETEVNKRTAVEQLHRSLRDLRRTRPDLIRQMLDQMQQSQWAQYMDVQNLDLQRDQFNLQRAAQRAYDRRANAQAASYASYAGSGGQHGSTYANNDGSNYQSQSNTHGGVTGSTDVPSGGGSASGGKGKTSYSDLIMQVLGGSGNKPRKPPKKK